MKEAMQRLVALGQVPVRLAKIWLNMTGRLTLVVALLAPLVLGARSAIGQEVRPPIEAAMRQIRVRAAFAGSTFYSWPGCDGTGSGPDYPPDDYYGDISPALGATLAGAINNNLSYIFATNVFITPASVAQVEGSLTWSANYCDPSDYPGYNALVASGIDEDNFGQVVYAILSEVLPSMYFSLTGQPETSIAGSWFSLQYESSDHYEDCDTGWDALQPGLQTQWDNNDGPQAYCQVVETCSIDTTTDWGFLNAHYDVGTGTITADFPNDSATASSVATVYLKVRVYCRLGDKQPPVTGYLDDSLMQYHQAGQIDSEGSLGPYADYGFDDFAFFDCNNAPGSNTCPDGINPPGSPALGKTQGWEIKSVFLITDTQFFPDEGSAECLDTAVDSPTTPENAPAGNGNLKKDPCDGPKAGKDSENDSDDKNAGNGNAETGDPPRAGMIYLDDWLNGTGVPSTPHPVSLAYGTKLESHTDLSVPLAGGSYSITRNYSSDPNIGGAGMVGEHWTLSAFRFISAGAGTHPDISMTDSLRQTLTYMYSSGKWSSGGPATQYFVEAVANGYPTYRLIEPGGWSMDFYRDGTEGSLTTPDEWVGLLAQERDEYGNLATYEYQLYGPSNSKNARLHRILLGGTGTASDAAAVLVFTWFIDGDNAAINGRLASVQLHRFDARRVAHLVEQVSYQYKQADDGVSDDVGTAGDLIQVTSFELVDQTADGSEPYYKRVTQYRYHRTSASPSGSDERLLVVGRDHQLKSMFMPEQIEYYAQQRNASSSVDANAALLDGAAYLLTLDDGDNPFTGATYEVVDVAAKVVSYSSSTDKVQTQYIQSSCGCSGGGTQGLKISYTYYNSTGDPSTRMQEYLQNGSGYDTSPYKVIYQDMVRLGAASVPYIENVAVVEPGGRTWVRHQEYDSNQNLIKVVSPSAAGTGGSAYVPVDQSGGPSYTALTNAGLVNFFVYNAANRPIEARVANGDKGNTASNYILVTRFTYPTSGALPANNLRAYLPTKIERWRTATTPESSTASDIETTTFQYTFHGDAQTSDMIASVRTSVEAELESENGPSGTGNTYDTYELYDEQGFNRWSRAPDGALTYRDFDAATGRITKIVRNADAAGDGEAYGELDGGDYGVTTTGWGRFTDGGSLTSTFALDLLGRTRSRTSPGGVTSYTVRSLDEFSERPGIYYFLTTSLPFQLPDDTFDGPASISWMNAGGGAVGASEFTIDGSEDYNPLALEYTLESTSAGQGEISRSTVQHELSGLVKSRKVWHDVAGNRSYTTEFTYDALGRLSFSTNAVGTINRQTYDVLDRVIEVEVGTSVGPSNLETVAEYFYDSTQTASQGTGDGNLTFIRQYTRDSTSGGLAADQRDTKRYFDFRNRLEEVQGPDTPYQFVVYDNLDRVTERALFKSDPIAIGTPIADRGLHTITSYSQRGLAYKRRVAFDPTDSSSPEYLESDSWFDENGREVASWMPNAPASKRTYDGLGRVEAEYVTDRGGDAAPGASGNYADAIALTGDTVYEQTEPTYNTGDGLLTRVTHRHRIHDSTTTGALTATISVSTFVDNIYDAADRRIGSINYGTNDTTGKQFIANTTGPSIQSSLPAFTDGAFVDAIISKMAYNTRGLVDSTGDSTSTTTGADRTTRYLYDDMGRRIAVIENYDDAVVEWDGTNGRWQVSSGLDHDEQDTDRVTSFVYDGHSNVVKQVAHTVNSSDQETVQITEYTYGIDAGSASTATDSLIYSNDILYQVHYPDESTGQPGTTNYTVSYSYNALGELRSVVDQNGTTHVYSRDLLGRVTSDAASFPGGSSIDQTVRSIAISYDDFSRLHTVNSKDSGGTVLNSVQFAYTGLWQVASVEQDVDGTIGAGGIAARTVGYTYDNSESDNHSLLQSLDYPDGTSFTYTYGPTAAEGRIARVGSMDISGTGGYTVANYSYVGLGMFAGVDYPVPDIQLDRTLSSDGKRRLAGYTTQSSGIYPGWDHLGRVRYHAWVDGNLTTGGGGHPDRPQLFAETYTYDRASNRTARYDDVPRYTNTWVSRDWQFQYDDLDRLTQSLRGTWNGSTLTLKKGSQEWSLDMLGNWSGFDEDRVQGSAWGSYGDSGDLNESRDHNSANELTQINPPTPAQPLAYDHTGNITDYTQPGGTVKRTYVHDAWNRLVKVENRNASTNALIGTLAEYEYNGLHWRTIKRADTDQTPDNAIDQQRLMYYNASWQLIEEHIDDAFNPGSGGSSSGHSDNRIAQNFWGLRYIDDMALRRIDDVGTGAGGSYEGRWFYLTDVQFSVRSLVRANGVVEESIDYDTYGNAKYHDPSDFDGDGLANSSDYYTFYAAWSGSDRSADFNRDGVLNSQDFFDYLAAFGSPVSVPGGWISNASPSGVGSGSGVGPDNQFGFDGYVINAESESYTARFRHYCPSLGRWIERDPKIYVDGTNIYLFASSTPVSVLDPFGERSIYDAIIDKISTAGGGSISGAIPPIPVGAACAINIVFTGSLEASECRDGCDEKTRICLSVDIEGYISCGKSKRGKSPIRNRDIRRQPGGIWKETNRGKQRALRHPSGYRDRFGRVGATTAAMPPCPKSFALNDVSGSVFVRGSAGAYIGIQGSANWSLNALFERDIDKFFSLENLTGTFDVAFGVYGASIEFGLNGHFGFCFTP